MSGLSMRYASYVGFVSPPNSFENSPQHFLQLVPDNAIGVTQHVVPAGCHRLLFVLGDSKSSRAAGQSRLRPIAGNHSVTILFRL